MNLNRETSNKSCQLNDFWNNSKNYKSKISKNYGQIKIIISNSQFIEYVQYQACKPKACNFIKKETMVLLFFGTKSEDPFNLDYKSVEETVGAGCRKSKGNEKNEV